MAAMLLQQQGYEVVGVFMRNWDESEETGNQNCSGARLVEGRAKLAARRLQARALFLTACTKRLLGASAAHEPPCC